MANSSIKLLTIVLFLAFISQGYGQCSLKDLSVQQSETGAKVEGKPEWKVTISNNCACVQTQVMLYCRGFKSVEPINPSILRILGNVCLVNSGNSIYQDPVTFTYASDNSFPLTPLSSQIACS